MVAGSDDVRLVVLRIVTSPAAWMVEVVVQPTPVCVSQGVVGEAESGAPRVLNSPPAEAVVSLETTVLLTKLTFSASSIDTPPPSQPATLSTIMLLVMLTPYQLSGPVLAFEPAKRATSWPLTPCSRIPPPLPLSAVLPWIRLESITRPGPVPSASPGGQSWSVTEPHSIVVPSGSVIVRSGAAARTARPPPWVGMVGLLLWLNRLQLWLKW